MTTTLNLDAEWLSAYRDEIGWAMSQADGIVARLRHFVDSNPGYRLIVASSMGQAATHAEPLETQIFVTNLARLMVALGLPADHGWSERPAMLPQCNVSIDEPFRGAFEAGLCGLCVGGHPVPHKRAADGFFSMQFGQNNLHDVPDAVTLHGVVRALDDVGLAAVEIEDRSDTTAYHVPEGALIVFNPNRRRDRHERRPLSVLTVAPALLSHFHVGVPAYMADPGDLALDLA